MGLVPDTATVLLLALLAGVGAGVAANTGHTLLDQEAEEFRAGPTTEHLHAVVRSRGRARCRRRPAAGRRHRPAPPRQRQLRLLARRRRLHPDAGRRAAAAGRRLVLGKADDRQGVPLRRDLREALRGGEPAQAPAATGFFIALEGGDGAGKSTQVEALAEWIRGKGHEVVVTREPGATPVGKRLRSILLDVSTSGLSNRAEALLYAADRAEHVDTRRPSRPGARRDRHLRPLHRLLRRLPGRRAATSRPTEIARISRWATDGLVPHLTVLLDVSPETARERFTEAPDRLESEPAEFHQRVRSGFLTLAAADPGALPGRRRRPGAGGRHHRRTAPARPGAPALRGRGEGAGGGPQGRRGRGPPQGRGRGRAQGRGGAPGARAPGAARQAARRGGGAQAPRAGGGAPREADRQAEEARQRAEEARRPAEEERQRREAEEQAREAEQERLRKQAEEEARLRAEAEERRLEKQRKAEEALLRAEEARRRRPRRLRRPRPRPRREAAADGRGGRGRGARRRRRGTVRGVLRTPGAGQARRVRRPDGGAAAVPGPRRRTAPR